MSKRNGKYEPTPEEVRITTKLKAIRNLTGFTNEAIGAEAGWQGCTLHFYLGNHGRLPRGFALRCLKAMRKLAVARAEEIMLDAKQRADDLLALVPDPDVALRKDQQ